MIKYIGSKRTLVPTIVALAKEAGGSTFLDLFSGTSRVGLAMKLAGWRVIANDHNSYAHTLARCYIQSDREDIYNKAAALIDEFNALPGRPGYITQTYCTDARYFRPENGERIDAIREAIAAKSLDPELEAVLLTSLMEAADRVDSTTGLQMAYLKRWAPRSANALHLRTPELAPRALSGKSKALMLDAADAAPIDADVAYLDPPYNQHSYLGNYHVWESLVRWDKPAVYGVARKREDCRDRRSSFNSRPNCGPALRRVLEHVRARTVILSFNDEGFVARDEIERTLRDIGGEHATLRVIENDYPRYVGARIGIYNPQGRKVGAVGRLRNTEFLYVLTRDQRSPSPTLPIPSVAHNSCTATTSS